MSELRVSRRAELDVDLAWLYIAEHNIDAATKLRNDLKDRFKMLSRQPQLGESRDDLAPGVRQFTVRNRVIFYRYDDAADAVVILRVIHGARDIPTVFAEDEETL